jgi:hypothetical protein
VHGKGVEISELRCSYAFRGGTGRRLRVKRRKESNGNERREMEGN